LSIALIFEHGIDRKLEPHSTGFVRRYIYSNGSEHFSLLFPEEQPSPPYNQIELIFQPL
jgi:hypothetical protein